MYLNKVLNQPNLIGIGMVALLLGAGFVYAFAFDGINVETVPGAEVDAWLAQEGEGDYGDDDDDTPEDGDEGDPCKCSATSDPYGECTCGNQIFRKTKTDKKGSWKDPCGGVVDPYPCPNGDGCRNSHSSSGNSDCSCDPYPGHDLTNPNSPPRQKLWTVCKITGKKQCNGKKGSCKRK